MLAEKYYSSTQTLDWLQDWNEADSMLDFVNCIRLNSLYSELTKDNWKWEKTNIKGFSCIYYTRTVLNTRQKDAFVLLEYYYLLIQYSSVKCCLAIASKRVVLLNY